MAKYTKGKLSDCLEAGHRILATENRIVIGILRGPCGVIPTEADIARIIKCWNCHDDWRGKALLTACKRLLGAMRCDELNCGRVFGDDLRKEVKEVAKVEKE